MPNLPELLNDKAIADALSMSKPWVRLQRYKRLRNEEHVFCVDPVYLGKSPRYRRQDFLDWVSALQTALRQPLT